MHGLVLKSLTILHSKLNAIPIKLIAIFSLKIFQKTTFVTI